MESDEGQEHHRHPFILDLPQTLPGIEMRLADEGAAHVDRAQHAEHRSDME